MRQINREGNQRRAERTGNPVEPVRQVRRRPLSSSNEMSLWPNSLITGLRLRRQIIRDQRDWENGGREQYMTQLKQARQQEASAFWRGMAADGVNVDKSTQGASKNDHTPDSGSNKGSSDTPKKD
jgi:hypothetical protein